MSSGFAKRFTNGVFRWVFGLFVIAAIGLSSCGLLAYHTRKAACENSSYFSVLKSISLQKGYSLTFDSKPIVFGDDSAPFINILEKATPVNVCDKCYPDAPEQFPDDFPSSQCGIHKITLGHAFGSDPPFMELFLPRWIRVLSDELYVSQRYFSIEPELVAQCFDLADRIVSESNQSI